MEKKAGDVRDTSLKVPSGVSGTVIGAKVFSREGAEPDSRSLTIQEQEAAKLRKDEKIGFQSQRLPVRKIVKIAGGRSLAEGAKDKDGNLVAQEGEVVTEELLEKWDINTWYNLTVADAEANKASVKGS